MRFIGQYKRRTAPWRSWRRKNRKSALLARISTNFRALSITYVAVYLPLCLQEVRFILQPEEIVDDSNYNTDVTS